MIVFGRMVGAKEGRGSLALNQPDETYKDASARTQVPRGVGSRPPRSATLQLVPGPFYKKYACAIN